MLIALTTFLLLPVAASCGWYFGRREPKQPASNNPVKFHHDYFKGLNYLINEQPDKAVDVFIKLLEVDSDTVETHLALGNLFRRRGEVDRAIRIHQNLIARPQLDKQYKVQALSALGQDYLRAGVLDRAERLFQELVKMGEENQQSLRFLIHIYQQEKDWVKAIESARKLQAITGESMRSIVAQYYCELAIQAREQGHIEEALSHLKNASVIDAHCVRASLIRAELNIEAKRYKEAIRCYKQVKLQDPDYLSETVASLVECYQKLDEEDQLIVYLKECLKDYPRISFVLAISNHLRRCKNDKAAIDYIAEQIQSHPSLRGVGHLVELYIANSAGDSKEKLTILYHFVDRLLEDKPIYRCSHCGYSGKTLFWLCPSCHHWLTQKPIQGLEER